MPPPAAQDVMLVCISTLVVYVLRHTYSVAATAYASVLVLQIAFEDQRWRPSARAPLSVHAAGQVLVDMLVKVTCSLLACGALVLFNQEVVIF